jgi:tetratricopeptide (TPR) repeat protein
MGDDERAGAVLERDPLARSDRSRRERGSDRATPQTRQLRGAELCAAATGFGSPAIPSAPKLGAHGGRQPRPELRRVAPVDRAWRRVLDYAPLDLQALQALAGHYAKLGDRRHQIDTLEQQLRAVEEIELRIDLAMSIARLWEDEGIPRAAVASYERVIRLDPEHADAREALLRLYQAAGQRERALGLLDYVGTFLDTEGRIGLLRRGLELLEEDEHEQRFWQLRRILWLSEGDERVLDELRASAREASLWNELAAVLTQLASTQTDAARRLELLRELSQLFEQSLKKRPRAYVVLQSALFSPQQAEAVLDELTRLATTTKRQEDLLALLDRLTTPDFELDQRKKVLSQRAEICAEQVDDAIRAFVEHRRRLELDPTDWSPLADLQQLCEANADREILWERLDLTYAELWDRTPNADRRIELLRRREEIARERLNAPKRAFEFLVRRYRHDPQSAELRELLLADAEAQDSWSWLLPLLEASALTSAAEDVRREELSTLVGLYERKLVDIERALVLSFDVFIGGMMDGQTLESMETLADKIERHDQLAAVLRLGAAATPDRALQAKLLGEIATIYEDKVKTPERAIDVHRRLLEIDRGQLRSLEVMLNWHRDQQQWRDLRDRLHQWLEVAPDEADATGCLLEIATISEQHLSDPEAALEAYGAVLARDPENKKARDGMEGLLEAISEPALRKRWLEMQLAAASPSSAVDIQLEIAQIQERDLNEVSGAIDTLQQLVERDSATGPAFTPLARLLREGERYEDLVRLLQKRAEQLDSPEEKLQTLDESLEICHERLSDRAEELREQLYRKVLELRPTDRPVRIRLARMLRNSERFSELAALHETIPDTTTHVDRMATLYELARIYALNLDERARADAVFEKVLELDDREEAALLALAASARSQGNHERYIELRKRQAALLAPAEGALILCHLAEVCDETPAVSASMVPLYREARAVDPDNVPAMEALKGIGRRLKSLRPAAALLPLEGERELEPSERAARLRALGDNALPSDADTALDWYRRAVAIEPDEPANWLCLAAALEQQPDTSEQLYRARRGWAQALERSRPLSASQLSEEARRLYELARAAHRAGEAEQYTATVQRAFDLMPSFAPAALATAEAQLEQDGAEDAHRLLHEVLEQHRGDLSDEQLVAALHGRGEALQRLGQIEDALRDFRDALRINPLHAASLVSIGQLLAQSHRAAAAMEHQVRALIALEEPVERAKQYYRLGLLLEDSLDRPDEAGACYELALAEGLDERELLHRALHHYKRSGRLDESLDVVEGLLPTAEEPSELAALWLARGEILAAREGCEDEAIEAFDMALSYEPGHAEARGGLVAVLERRGDWNQVLQVLEASCDVGTAEQRADALRRMATICLERLGDEDRAEEYLRQSANTYPTAEALHQLEQLYGTDEARHEERKDVLGLLVAFGPPWFSRCLELGKLLLMDDEQWAWCLLSPLLGVSQIESNTKTLLQGMRKDHERPALRSPYGAAEQRDLLAHPNAQREIAGVLAELLEHVPDLGRRDVDAVGESGAIAIGATTGLGRKFFALSEQSGLTTCTLHRTQGLDEPITVVNEADGPRIVVRTDVLQQLVHAEVGFLFGYALELAQPGPRTMAVLDPDARAALLPALWGALGFVEKAPRSARGLVQRITNDVEQDVRARWAEQLQPLADIDPVELGQQWWAAVGYMARRVGLLAGADLRQAFRVIARIEPEVPRPRVVARLEELDSYVGSSDVLRDIVAFAASPAFGQLLREAPEIEIEQ